jgi:hypothetical protein
MSIKDNINIKYAYENIYFHKSNDIKYDIKIKILIKENLYH